MKKLIVMLILASLLLGAGTVVTMTATGSSAAAGPASESGSPPIPAPMLALYLRAAGDCPGLPWTVLAAIGTIESDDDTSDLPGVHSGHNAAGAEGPMQFMPATFAAYDEPVPPGGVDPPSPYDPVDAVYAAARMLCANGAADPERLAGALYDYDHSAAYVARVLSLAASYGLAGAPPAASGAGAQAAAYGMRQIGTPYVWGGESAGVGFDCSGLAQAAWAAAGVRIPRVAQDQFDDEAPLPAGSSPRPGDLVFFGSGPDGVSHVGIVVGEGMMVDAPHTGAAVRVEAFPVQVGAAWGGDVFVGARRPG